MIAMLQQNGVYVMCRELIPNELSLTIPLEMIATVGYHVDYSSFVLNKCIIRGKCCSKGS